MTDSTNATETKSKKRRPKGEHHVDFTDEFIASMPAGKNYMDFWYDLHRPYLIARRVRADEPVEFLFRYNIQQRKANLAMNLIKVPLYGKIGRVSLAKAREVAERMHLEMQAVVFRYERTQIPIPNHGSFAANAKALLAPVKDNANPNYEKLMDVLTEAYGRAANGKGKERHASGLDFEDQDMIKIMDEVGIGFSLGQALKKVVEGNRLKIGDARSEFLDAIVYLAGSIVWLDRQISRPLE